MYAIVEVQGTTHHLAAGTLIGRGAQMGLQIADPTISEAHALCSHREDGLVLLPLRGEVRVFGEPAPRVQLRRGAVVELTHDIHLHVLDVIMPTDELVLTAGDLTVPMPLGHRSLSSDDLGLPPSDTPWADLWRAGEHHFLRLSGQPAQQLHEGDQHTIGTSTFTVQRRPSPNQPIRQTQRRYVLAHELDQVELRVQREVLCRFDQRQAEVLHVLALRPASSPTMHWTDLARQVWGRSYSRNGYDNVVNRAVKRATEAGLPCLFERSGRPGYIELNRADYVVVPLRLPHA